MDVKSGRDDHIGDSAECRMRSAECGNLPKRQAGRPGTDTLLCRPGVGTRLDAAVILVKSRLQQDDGRQAAGHGGDFAGLFAPKRAAEKFLLAVTQPLLDNLVAADVILPHAGRDVFPERPVIQVHVVRLAAEKGQGLPGRQVRCLGMFTRQGKQPHLLRSARLTYRLAAAPSPPTASQDEAYPRPISSGLCGYSPGHGGRSRQQACSTPA